MSEYNHPALISAAHANFLGSFRKLAEHADGGEVRTFESVFAFVTGIPAPLLNGCVLIEGASPAALEEALRWVARSGLPFRVFTASEPATALNPVLAAYSLSRDSAPYPGMILYPVPDPPPPPAHIEVAEGLAPGLATYLPASFPDDVDVRVFSAWVDREPAGVSIAIRTGEASGVYGVGTLPQFRRRGVGTALSWAAVSAGREWGCEAIVLQATAAGLPVYERMGFRSIVRYATFTRLGS